MRTHHPSSGSHDGRALAVRLVEALEVRIAALGAGDRLPAERVLAQELGVSRSSIREAIQQLVSRGRLVARQGGGTFVQEPDHAWTGGGLIAPLAPLVRDDPAYWRDVIEIRRSLDASAAFFAATRATAEDKARLEACLAQMSARHSPGDPEEDARADVAFHMAVADASHNLVLRHVMAGLLDLLQASISQSLAKLYSVPRTFETLERQHRVLAEAILAGTPETARDAALQHLDFVEQTLRQIEEDAARLRRASMPLRQKGNAR